MLLQPRAAQGQGITEGVGIAAHQQLPAARAAMDGEGHLQAGRDHQKQWIKTVVLLKRQTTEADAVLVLHPTAWQGSVEGPEPIQVLRCPHPSLQMAQQVRFVQRGEGRGHPDALLDPPLKQSFLNDFQARPPQPANAGFIAATRCGVQGQPLPQVLEAGVAHHRLSRPLRLWRTTDRQRPRQMKFTNIAERP